MARKKLIERREHKRYTVKNRIFAVIRSKDHRLDDIDQMSKCEIALAVIKSKPPKMGEIIDISRGGLSFSYIENKTTLDQCNEMDILFVDEDFHISRMPIVPVKDSEFNPDAPFNALTMKRLEVRFKGLDNRQTKQLDYVLKNFTIRDSSVAPVTTGQQVWGGRLQQNMHLAFDPIYG